MNKERVLRIKEIIKDNCVELMESRKRCFPMEYELAMKELDQEKAAGQEQKLEGVMA
jgi:hypothetical protein